MGLPSRGVPLTPPRAVLDEVGAAAYRVEQLAAEQLELHFERNEATGRVVAQVRDLGTGEVVRTIRPAEALDVLSGMAVRP